MLKKNSIEFIPGIIWGCCYSPEIKKLKWIPRHLGKSGWHVDLRGQFHPKPSKNSLTRPKTNMEPENEPLEEEIPMENHHF